MTRYYKILTISFLPISLFIISLSGCDKLEAGSDDVQSNNIKAEVAAKDLTVIDNYKRLCSSMQIGLDNLASDIQDISAVELKENIASGNGSLLSIKLVDINRGLSDACNNNDKLDVSINVFATAVAGFGREVGRALTEQSDATDIDRSLMNSYREVARKLSGLMDDMNKLLSIAPDYKIAVETTK